MLGEQRKVRAAIVGTGNIASEHVEALQALRTEVTVVAAVDVDEERVGGFSESYAIPSIYSSVGEMLERESPDLVTVCTPPGTHTEITVTCLRSGAWVLCEKPLCGSLAELDRIQEAERRSGAFCATVAQLRFGAAAQHVRRLIRSGDLGNPLVAICNTLWFRDSDYYSVPWRGRWATELGGVTLNLGIHEIDLLLWLLGDWTRVSAITETLGRDIEVDDVSMATVHFESRAVASVVSSVLSPREESYLRVDCERATVELNHLYGYENQDLRITEKTVGRADSPSGWQSIPGDHRGEIASQITQVVRCRRDGSPPPITTQEARKTIEFMAALYKSAATGESVRRGVLSASDPFYRGMSPRSTP